MAHHDWMTSGGLIIRQVFGSPDWEPGTFWVAHMRVWTHSLVPNAFSRTSVARAGGATTAVEIVHVIGGPPAHQLPCVNDRKIKGGNTTAMHNQGSIASVLYANTIPCGSCILCAKEPGTKGTHLLPWDFSRTLAILFLSSSRNSCCTLSSVHI